MITRLTPITELKELFVKILLNNTDRVTKVSDESILNGMGYGAAKIGQKCIKDIALVESHIFVDSAFGTDLDFVAKARGIAPRLGAIGSSTFILLVGTPGITYLQGVHSFTGSHGVTFDLEEDFTIPLVGFGYTKVRSIDTGTKTNVDPLTINQMVVSLAGHQYLINEYQAIGGRDAEDDDTFKKRIKEESVNILAQETLARITQVFININPNILRVFYNGKDSTGKIVLGISTQNGADLSSTELDALLEEGEKYICLSDYAKFGNQALGIVLQNSDYEPIDVDFRVELYTNYSPDDIRINIQIAFTKYLDIRYWEYGQKVQWDDLLQLVKNVTGVKYVPDTQFVPSADISIPKNKVPRVRSFIMRNLEGAILVDLPGNLIPVYYTNTVDYNYQNTILNIG